MFEPTVANGELTRLETLWDMLMEFQGGLRYLRY